MGIIAALASAKVRAIVLGPGGLGVSALMFAITGLAMLVATLGVGQGLVRELAPLVAAGDLARVAVFRRAALLVRSMTVVVAVSALVLFRHPIARWGVGSDQFAGAVTWLAIGLALQLLAELEMSILNAFHKVGSQVRVALISTVIGTVVQLLMILNWGVAGIAPGVAASGLVGFVLATLARRRDVALPAVRMGAEALRSAGRSLLGFGFPFTAAMLAGTATQTVVPLLVLHISGVSSVAFYQAATAIAGAYLGFLGGAMSQDYYPRVAALRSQPEQLVHAINEQQRLVTTITLPLIFVVLAVGPYVIPAAYTSAFKPAIGILEWQLIGDFFRFTSWSLAFVILARSPGITSFGIELFGGVVYLTASVVGLLVFGLPGLGISWIVCYASYTALVWFILRRQIGFRWSAVNVRYGVVAMGALIIVRLLSSFAPEVVRLPVTLLIAGAATLVSLRTIRNELGGTGLVARFRPKVAELVPELPDPASPQV